MNPLCMARHFLVIYPVSADIMEDNRMISKPDLIQQSELSAYLV